MLHRTRLGLAAGAGAAAGLAAAPALAHGTAAAEPTLGAVAVTWLADPLPWAAAIAAIAGYLLLVGKVNAAHPRNRVPRWRIAAWLLGVALGLLALVSAIDVYAEELLWVHMVQHLLLSMVVPPLLALGAPVTLLLRAATPGVRQRSLLPALHSRVVGALASPLVAWTLFTLVMWATHFTAIYDAALEDPVLHLLEHLAFVATGVLFWWPVVAADPGPRRMSYAGRAVYLLAQMPVSAAVGLAIYFAPGILYQHYATNERTWGPTPLLDQQVGGLLMWAAGDLVMLLAVAALVAAWMRADVRRSRRLDLRRAALEEPAD